MLTLFNRTEVFITYSKENMEKASFVLSHHNVDHTVKTTTVADAYAQEETLQTAYKIYVRKDCAEKAQRLIHRILFED